jgi:hypothetical protein
MSSSDSVSSEKPANAFRAEIDEICDLFRSFEKSSRAVFETKGANKLQNGKTTITNTDGSSVTIGLSDVRSAAQKILNKIRNLEKLKNSEKKRERDERKARRSAPRALPPCQFQAPLVEFFKSVDLGKGANGKRLQDDSEMAYFFKNGIGRLTFGVSLFNVWGNIQKLATKSGDVTLSDKDRVHLKAALERLREVKRQNIADGKKGAAEDMAKFEAGQLQNKDYMTILSFYSVQDKEAAAKLTPYIEQVNKMSQITKDLNTKYADQIKAAKPQKPKVERKKPSTPVRKSAPVAAPAAKAEPKAKGKAAAAPAPAPAKASVASPSKGKAAAKR